MGTQTQGRPDKNTRILRWAAASALFGLLLVYQSVDAATTPEPKKQPEATASAAASPGAGAPYGATGEAERRGPALPPSPPTRLEIPALAVNAPFTGLTLDDEGRLNAPPPDDTNLVGWFRNGPTPGERGNAIVAGHVDTRTGPAVFWPLSSIKRGNKVTVTREDGIVATFVVDDVETFAKDDFPDARVYGDTADAQLRLITCGGTFDQAERDYTANVVVFAHLTSFRWA